MLFNSINFILFLPVVFFFYWFVANKKLWLQNLWILLASYFFYACWDWRFLFLLIFSTLLDYSSGIKIASCSTAYGKKVWLWISISVNLGFLGVFKYFNFFVESFVDAAHTIGVFLPSTTIHLLLPVGISFYTFHGLSYIIDVYKGRMEPERNVIDYSVFVSFFPLLVAGPIERAAHLLPQIKQKRNFDYANAVDGLRQITWGLFKKVVIADQCAIYANMIFHTPENYTGSTLLLGAMLFSFQIYGDFSGYSDIALGTARLFGIELLKNFSFPYFSRDIAEFWRRWHISLSTWFRDYVYIPLGGSKGSIIKTILNVVIIFLISGFWHGANWTFIIWGLLNALFIIPSVLLQTNRLNMDVVAKGKMIPSVRAFASMAVTFLIISFAWIFFRSPSVTHAMHYIELLFSNSILQFPDLFPKRIIFFLAVFIFIEWIGREHNYAIEKNPLKWPSVVRWGFYYTLLLMVCYYAGADQPFIYFQF